MKTQIKRDIYADVTNRIIEALEEGHAPWVRPWKVVGSGVPMNAVSKKAYRGMNTLLLTMSRFGNGYEHDLWLTYKQAADCGTFPKKGSHGEQIIFWKRNMYTEQHDDGTEDTKVVPMLRTYTVFNVAQLDDPTVIDIPKVEQHRWRGKSKVEALVKTHDIKLIHGGDKACFIPSKDEVHMPKKGQFESAGNYYATLLHEFTHWTGAKPRLNRIEPFARFGTESYAAEELVAELGAAFLCAEYGIKGQLQHPQYIKSWLKVLGDDKKFIFRAASLAQKAADFLLETKFEEEEQQAA